MADQRRKFSREFRLEAVRRVSEGRETAVEIRASAGRPTDMLYGWVRQFKSEADEAFRGNGKLTAQDEELRRLRA